MFPKITIEQHRSDLITGEVEVGGLIARRRDSTSHDKPLRFTNLADAFRAVWEAVHELRNEPVPPLVLGPQKAAMPAVECEEAPASQDGPGVVMDALESAPEPPHEDPKTLDTAPPAPRRRGRPRRRRAHDPS